ncbi:MAG: ABC transporter [Ruminococcaceae bacterium]|nr:ABC transporter [Oscillospiraceae bacterium]
MGAIYRKELKAYFSNMTGYIAMAMILLMTSVFVKLYCFDAKYPTMEYALPTATVILMLAIPILAMRSFAEERRQKTDLLLYTLPISTTQIVLGKYFAMLTVLAVPTAVLLFYPLLLSLYGTVNLLASYASILLFYLLAAAMTAICMFMSSLTESQVIAAVLGSGTLILCYFAQILSAALPTSSLASYIAFTVVICLVALAVYSFTKNYWVAFSTAVVLEAILLIVFMINRSLFMGLFQKAVGKIALFDIFNASVSSQLFDLTTVIYFLSVSVLFSFLTIQTVEKRRFS